jgi:hypothetical protein
MGRPSLKPPLFPRPLQCVVSAPPSSDGPFLEPRDNEGRDIRHGGGKIRPKIYGGMAVSPVGHPVDLHKGHGTELTGPRTTRPLLRHGEGTGPLTQGLLPLHRDDIFVATGNRAEVDAEGVPRWAHPSERLDHGGRPTEARQPWRPKVIAVHAWRNQPISSWSGTMISVCIGPPQHVLRMLWLLFCGLDIMTSEGSAAPRVNRG